MNIINIIKKLFVNNEEKVDFSKTSTDNILLKNQLIMLDRKIQDIETYIDTLNRYNTVQKYEITQNDDFTTDGLTLCIVGNICLITGILYSKRAVSGSSILNLPFKIFPTTRNIRDWTPFIADGNNYRFHAELTNESNYSQIVMFAYDTIPQNTIVPINLVFPINPNYVAHTE